jgi:hypothetical protein
MLWRLQLRLLFVVGRLRRLLSSSTFPTLMQVIMAGSTKVEPANCVLLAALPKQIDARGRRADFG